MKCGLKWAAPKVVDGSKHVGYVQQECVLEKGHTGDHRSASKVTCKLYTKAPLIEAELKEQMTQITLRIEAAEQLVKDAEFGSLPRQFRNVASLIEMQAEALRHHIIGKSASKGTT